MLIKGTASLEVKNSERNRELENFASLEPRVCEVLLHNFSFFLQNQKDVKIEFFFALLLIFLIQDFIFQIDQASKHIFTDFAPNPWLNTLFFYPLPSFIDLSIFHEIVCIFFFSAELSLILWLKRIYKVAFFKDA